MRRARTLLLTLSLTGYLVLIVAGYGSIVGWNNVTAGLARYAAEGVLMTKTWLDFIASIVGSVAWPAAIAFVVWLFRQEIVRLLPFLHVKGGDLEVSFRLAEAEKTAASLPTPQEPPQPETPVEKTQFAQLFEMSPSAAMVEIRKELEIAMRATGERAGIPDLRYSTSRNLLRALVKTGLLDASTTALIDDLLVIGNQAAHENVDITLSEALQYRSLADRVISVLNSGSLNNDALSS